MSDSITAPLASLSLTHVLYTPDDALSYACAWLALVPQGLCVVYASLIWSTREAEIILMFMGQMACEAFNWMLKRYIKAERPRQMNGKGYGMPSSHAQFVAFFAVSLALFLLRRHQQSPSPSPPPPPPYVLLSSRTERLLVSGGVLAGAAAVATSRVYLAYHTPGQVLVGSGAGAAFAVLWFVGTGWLRRSGWLDVLLDSRPAALFKLRDLVVGEDLVDAGWLRWQMLRRQRTRTGQGVPAPKLQ
ncbi:MAG: hypothetical protein M1826_002723 [Phylliscum demangeonii]|nr:MAG: hypothetical protein M1826_002723 [Phylliscum demangeonii]